jgi:STE24 endopeptidase
LATKLRAIRVQLAILLAVLCALSQTESAAEPIGGALWRAALTLVGVLVAPLAAALGSLRLVREPASESVIASQQSPRLWSRVQTVAVTLWLVTVAATMYAIQWPRVVRSDWALAAWPLVDELLILLPVIAPLLLYWAVLFRVRWSAQSAAARARGEAPPQLRLASLIVQSARHHLALVLAPVLIVIAAQEFLTHFWPQAQAGAAWIYLPLLAGMLVLLPIALRRIWHTTPLPPGELRDRLGESCLEQRVGVREILIWQTDGQILNAAVAGMLPGMRYLFLTDGLLARLAPEEVAAVVRHELGHITGRHMPLRMLVLALPLALWMAASSAWPEFFELLSQRLAWIGFGASMQLSLLVPVLLAAYIVVVVGQYSQWLEHDADLAACLGPNGQVDRAAAVPFARALVKIIGRSPESRFTRWLHPALSDRMAVIAVALADPAGIVRFRRRLMWSAWGLVACYLWIAAAMLYLNFGTVFAAM